MISHTNKFIFVQIPKTGCTSIESVLQSHAEPVLQGHHSWDSPQHKHITLKAQQRLLGQAMFEQYYKFAFVRNPYSWLVSNYFFCGGLHVPYHRDKPELMRLSESPGLVKDWLKDHKSITTFKQWLKWYVEHVNGTQLEMICDSTGLVAVDFVGKLETIDQDFDTVCDKLGLARARVPHVNRTPRKHKHYMEYYDDETRSIVEKHYAEDLEHFEYTYVE